MGVPLGTSFDVAEASPVDSRMTWTGTAGNLNQIAANGANRYPGLITYVTGDQNLYVFQGNNTWEKIVTNNVDSLNSGVSFTLDSSFNGQVLYINSVTGVNVFLPPSGPSTNAMGNGYNVTLVQAGAGVITFNGSPDTFFRNRFAFTKTAGQYAIASILRVGNSNDFLLYGDLI